MTEGSELLRSEDPANGYRAAFALQQSINFVRQGSCHMCRCKSRVVYQCHKHFQALSCEKRFCLDCLTLIYKDNVLATLQSSDSWRCPFARKVCRCRPCCVARKESQAVLDLDPMQSVYSNLRMKLQPTPQDEDSNSENEVDDSMRWLLRERVKKLIDFNQTLIGKVNLNYHRLTEDEIKFYNKLIQKNLRVLNGVAKNVIAQQSFVEE